MFAASAVRDGFGRASKGRWRPPLLGLDKLGRDELSRVIFGARISLFTGVVSVIIGLTLGGLGVAGAQAAGSTPS